MTEDPAKVPVTVVTGFLGAGKTTLVNHILQGAHGKKIAVIENEFGEVGIDDALVMETKEEIFEMNNGCVCCTVRGDLIRILNKLLKKRTKFDAIIIETTGLANPAPVIQTFFVDEDLKDACQLDAVLTVVDCKHLIQHLDEEKPDDVVNEAVQQVAFADKILLNKIDLVTGTEKANVIKRIKAINKTAEIIECQNSVVDLDKLLGISAFSMDRMLEMDPEFLEDDTDHHEHHSHDHKGDSSHEDHHHHSHLDHKHDSRVTSVGIVSDGSADMRKLNGWLSTLLQERGADLFRSKGILSIQGSYDKWVLGRRELGGNRGRFSSSAGGAGRPWAPDEKRYCKLVFIGKNLDRQELTDAFNACLVPADGSSDIDAVA
eukprot:gene9293-9458_t